MKHVLVDAGGTAFQVLTWHGYQRWVDRLREQFGGQHHQALRVRTPEGERVFFSVEDYLASFKVREIGEAEAAALHALFSLGDHSFVCYGSPEVFRPRPASAVAPPAASR